MNNVSRHARLLPPPAPSTLPYPTLLYPTLLYPTLLYSTLPCSTLPYPTLPSYNTLPYPIIPYRTPYFVLMLLPPLASGFAHHGAADALPCPAPPLLCFAHLFSALPCPALLCCALPCPALHCGILPLLPCLALPCPALPCPLLPSPALPPAWANGPGLGLDRRWIHRNGICSRTSSATVIWRT